MGPPTHQTSEPSGTQLRFAWLRRVLEKRSASVAGILSVVVCGFVGWMQIVPNAIVIWAVFAVILFEFQKRLDQGIPLLQLTCLIAVMQWLIGPQLNYSSELQFGRYSMYVADSVYFQFAIPATSFFCALMLATGASVRQRNLLEGTNRAKFFTIGVVLFVIATVASRFATGSGGGFAFFFFLFSQLRYVAALYFLFSKSQLRYPAAALSCFELFSRSVESGMFHDLIIWMAIIFCYWFALRRWPIGVKFSVLTLSAFALFSIQVVKHEYREQLRRGNDPSLITLVSEYVRPGGQGWTTDSLSMVITRLNQGWIISAIMNHVPENEPFAGGETVKEAAMASLLPRFLWEGKRGAGGRQNFRRFTGLEISDSTSMGISPLGEAYANFGPLGGIVFMVVFGGLFALGYYWTLRFTLRHPTFLFWIPLIFYQAMKAETELVVILNQLSKGSAVAFSMHYLITRTFLPGRPTAPRSIASPKQQNRLA